MIYERVEIKDICKIKSGKRLPKGTVFAEGKTNYPYIRARDIKHGAINGDDLVYLTEEVQKQIQKYIVNTGDIVITIVGAVGDVGYVKAEFNGFNLTENAVRLTDFDERVNPCYLLYILNSKKYWELMQQIAGGSAQPKLGIYKIESIPLELPSIEVQNKIVAILTAYDKLIENNQKQIGFLEEAAQRLYKEWFVDLRFPGYEDVAVIDGVPEGWRIHSIDDVFLIKYGKTLPTSKIAKEGKYPVYGANGIIGYYHQKNCSNYVVLITSRGNGSGEVSRTHDKESFVTNNSFTVNSINKSWGIPYIYQLMKSIDFRSIRTGSAQPQLTNNSISMVKLLIPNIEIIYGFCAIAQPLYNKIEQLITQNSLLAQSRDRLLPKLMSGELEV